MAAGRPLGVYFVVLGAALVVSVGRLRELALGEAPLALWVPFARALLSAAFEMALIAGVPAAALAAWALRRDGRAALALALGLGLGSAGVAVVMHPGRAAPGRLAQELIDAARASCPQTPGRRVTIPFITAAWSCPSGRAPLVTGSPPGLDKSRFDASALEVGDDLRKLELADFRLEVPSSGERPRVRVSTRSAIFRGLPSWGRPASVPLAARLSIALLGVLLSIGAALWLSVGVRAGALAATGIGLLAGGASLFVERLLDRFEAGASHYVLVIPAGGLAVLALALAVLAARISARAARSVRQRRRA